MRHPHCAAVEAHIQAVVRLAFLAKSALSTSPAWIDDNALADTEVPNAGSGFVTSPAISWPRYGLPHSHRAEAAVQVVVQIGAADAPVPDANHRLAGPTAGHSTSSMRKSRGAWTTAAFMGSLQGSLGSSILTARCPARAKAADGSPATASGIAASAGIAVPAPTVGTRCGGHGLVGNPERPSALTGQAHAISRCWTPLPPVAPTLPSPLPSSWSGSCTACSTAWSAASILRCLTAAWTSRQPADLAAAGIVNRGRIHSPPAIRRSRPKARSTEKRRRARSHWRARWRRKARET